MGRRQDFEAALQSLKTELIVDVNGTDVLDKEKMDGLLLEYNQKLVNVQVQFLKMLSSADSKVSVTFTKPAAGSVEDAGTIALTGLTAGTTVTAGLSFITLYTIPTTTWFFLGRSGNSSKWYWLPSRLSPSHKRFGRFVRRSGNTACR